MSEVVAQVRSGFQRIANNAPSLGIFYSSIHLAGWSAGAHLASMIVVDHGAEVSLKAPASLLLISGVYDLRPLLLTSANTDLALGLAEAKGNSPLDAQAPPRVSATAILWGARETDEFKRQSAMLHDAWRGTLDELLSIEIPNVHHYGAMDAFGQDGSIVFQTALRLLDVPHA